MDNLIFAFIDAGFVSQTLGEMYQANKNAIQSIDRQLDWLYAGNLQKNENRIRNLEKRKARLNHAI